MKSTCRSLRQPKRAADFADLSGVACGVECEDNQILLASDGTEEGMRGGVGAEIFVALLDEVDAARAALIKLLKGRGESGKPTRWVRTVRSADFSRAVRDFAQEAFFAAAIPRGRSRSQFGRDDGKHKMLGNSHVFDAIEHRPLIRGGADARSFFTDGCRGGEECFARFSEEL